MSFDFHIIIVFANVSDLVFRRYIVRSTMLPGYPGVRLTDRRKSRARKIVRSRTLRGAFANKRFIADRYQRTARVPVIIVPIVIKYGGRARKLSEMSAAYRYRDRSREITNYLDAYAYRYLDARERVPLREYSRSFRVIQSPLPIDINA